jgi:pyridinium-3,5-biscarboxylic acid mononucleotide synthase
MTADDAGPDAGDLTFDFERRQRIGLAETVLCAGKSTGQLERILAETSTRLPNLLLTRLAEASYLALATKWVEAIDYDATSRTGILGACPAAAGPARVAVVTAGSSDLGVAREAVRTLAFYGEAATEVHDVGVAGLWRILERQETLQRHAVVIVAAGMDGALVSVVGGLVPGAVIALPTSTGYGAARGGETALSAALTSCAPGVLAVNIDNGYGAATAALRILHASRPR